jgi:hypothetical protein
MNNHYVIFSINDEEYDELEAQSRRYDVLLDHMARLHFRSSLSSSRSILRHREQDKDEFNYMEL